MTKPNVLVIGAGPSGLVTLGALSEHCNVKAYERASRVGGQWAGLGDSKVDNELVEKYGQRHSSLYHGLWINGPKEAGIELPNFPFAKDVPSYFKADTMLKYLTDFMTHFGLEKKIICNRNVETVKFCDDTQKFTVSTKNLDTDEDEIELFDYVIIATGHFSYPHDPHFKGEETFPGKYIHAHDFIDGKLFKDLRVLCIGGSYSAEDIALQCWKFGAKSAHVTHRSQTRMDYPDWPSSVLERPILTNIEGSKVTFKDGETDEYDAIIKCTGYLHKFDFLDESLQLKTRNILCPPDLYRQTVSMKNSKLMYIGMQDLYYTYTLFQAQAFLCRDIILGKFTVPSMKEQEKHLADDQAELAKCGDCYEEIGYQTRFVNSLTQLTGEPSADCEKIFLEWEHQKHASILGFRNETFTSIYTGFEGPKQPKTWVEDLE